MVMRRSDIKRISKDVSDTLEDNPKRTKVHAQRKFAQGSGMNSPVMTPVKDKEKTKVNGTSSSPELLPSKRPRTEDFLTFLCFRGTEALPPTLDFFNVTSKSPKQEKDGVAPGSSKQSSVSQQENKVKRVKNRLKNTKVVHTLKKKLHEKRLATRSTRLSQKIPATSALRTKSRPIEDRQKKGSIITKKQLVRGRPAHHPSILKRLGATRLRTGLRSGGQLPPGSDIGIKSDRKPRKKLMRSKTSKVKKGVVTRANITKRKTEKRESEDEDVNEENEGEEEDGNEQKTDDTNEGRKQDDPAEESDSKEGGSIEPASKKSCRMSTRSRASSGSPAHPPNSLSVPTRPSRKTKEAATLYMEMLTKDLRSPEEEEDEGFGKVSPENTSCANKKTDDIPESTLSPGKKMKQSKSIEQDVDKERQVSDVPVMTRASRRGRVKREVENSNRDNVRVTRGQRSGFQQRGRPSLRRGRGRPPLTRAPEVHRVLRNVRKVTNFAEDESETEDEEDEMYVESILSEEMERLEMGPGRLRPAKISSSIVKSGKSNKNEIGDSADEQESRGRQVEKRKFNKRITRSSSINTAHKAVEDSSEEESRRQTRASKDKEAIVKERKRSLPTRRSRPNNSESEIEKNGNSSKEKPPSKKGRRDSIEIAKDSTDRENQISSGPKSDLSTVGKKSFFAEKKEVEDPSAKVPRNQSDQSVAYLLLSLAQVKRWPESETDGLSNEDVAMRSTRSSLKDLPKEEIRNRRGRRRNTSIDSGLMSEKTEEEIPTTSYKKNKRESLNSESLQRNKTRSSKTPLNKGEVEVHTDNEQSSALISKVNQSEDFVSKRLPKKESLSNKSKIQDNRTSSESDEDKNVTRKNGKPLNDDGSPAFYSKRTRRHKTVNKGNGGSSESEADVKSTDPKIKDKTEVKREKRGRKKTSIPKNTSLNSELGEKEAGSDFKNTTTKTSGSLQNFLADNMMPSVSDSLKGTSLDMSQKVKEDTIGIDRASDEGFKMKGEVLKEEEHHFKKAKAVSELLNVNKDAKVMHNEDKRKPVMVRKSSADSSSSHSSLVDCKVMLEPIDVADTYVKKGKEKHKVNKTLEKAKDNAPADLEYDSGNLEGGSYMKVGYKDGEVQENLLPPVSNELSSLDQVGNENEIATKLEISLKSQNKLIKDTSSSDESDRELNVKGKKELENRASFESRKRFPRRSRIEYFSHSSNRDAPKRTFHSRKVKSVSERYIDEDSYSSDISSSSEEPQVSALKTHKRIKPKNSTQNDAIESAIREAQNAAALKVEQKEQVSCHSKKVDPVLKSRVSLPSSIPEVNLKSELQDNVNKTLDTRHYQHSSTAGLEESKSFESLVNVAHETVKTLVAHQSNVTDMTDNLALITKPLSSGDSAFFKHEHMPQTNTSGIKTNLINLGIDSTVKQSIIEGESKKQSMSETWRQAFKNAKIPKPGQSSPVPHGVKPFVRKPFGTSSLGSKQTDILKGINTNITKMSTAMNQFKSSTFQSRGKCSPSRPFPGEDSMKSQSPSRRGIEVRDSPSKSSVSSSDDSRVIPSDGKKINEQPVKSLTQLQYEKRSSDLISSLKDAPIIIDPSCPLAPFTSKLKEAAIEATPQRVSKTGSPSPLKPAAEGKHLNLPLAVEHTLRKLSPITVSKKPLIGKSVTQTDKKLSPTPFSEKQKEMTDEVKEDSIKSDPQIEETTAPRTSNIEMLGKKKVNMTTEEIKRWLDDSTSSGIEHAKDCGIFEKNQCECSYRTSGASMLVGRGAIGEPSSEAADNRGIITTCQQTMPNTGNEIKVDRGFVEPPVQLRELAEIASKYGGEIITCKVEEYRDSLLSKNKDATQKQSRRRQSSSFKSDRSMTEEEMCEFDFRFDRSSNSPRESGSEMSSPPPLRDDVSDKSDHQHISPSERKPIFQQRRSCGVALKRPPQSKSPAAAFSAENESSVYAFEPEEPPVSLLDKPFRRRSSKGTREDETPSLPAQQPPSSSIAVQVNLESEAVLETEAVLECCTTQTDHSQDDEENGSGGRSFYIPIEPGSSQLTPQQTIKGVTLKVESEGPNNQRVMLRAKLVTKPPSNFATPSTSHRSLVEGNTENGGSTGGSRRRPEQKVRPLSARAPPPVGTVQPTLREGTEQTITSIPTKIEKPKQASQGTQSSPRPISANPPPSNMSEPSDSAGMLKSKGIGKVGSNPLPEVEDGNFPQHGVTSTASMLEAPTFYPTEKEFGDPLEYIEKITPLAQHHGICRIVPPSSFKPECKVSDEMRFTAYNQYIHKMLHRWGPNVREMSAIRKYLATQNIALNQPPWIGGIEVDLPRLYQTVQQCGGLKEVYEKKRWTKVADVMKIPRSAQDRVTKLDDIYCKFLLPYDTLSHSERSKLLEEVEVEWREREKRMLEEDEGVEKEEGSDNESDTDERDECITKGKSVALSGFYRIARNTMSMWFSKDSTPSPVEVENEFWRHVTTGTAHVCVHSGSIDTSTWGCGFPTVKERSSARHPWNLKILTNNPRSILRSLGPVIGVTVPTLHVGMLFSACCWYRDPHALPWIEYLHTGASKIWYGVPDSWSEELKIAVKRLMPRYCRDKKKIWLASDTVMVPPQRLVGHGVSLCRTVQEPGQFVVVFPRAFTSSLCTGYLVSESVYFAHSSWLDTSRSVFKDIQDSCEPPIFSLEKLLFNIATDIRSSGEVLSQILPMVIELRNEEVSRRKILEGYGLVADEKLPVTKGRRTKSQEEPNEYECDICRGNLFLSLVTNTQDEINYCLVHAIEVISKEKDVLKHCKLMYAYDEEEMEELIEKIRNKIEIKKNQKKQGKNANTSSSSKS